MNVVAIDPGATTGWAAALVDEEALSRRSVDGPWIEMYQAGEVGLMHGQIEAMEGADPYSLDRSELYRRERAAARVIVGIVMSFDEEGRAVRAYNGEFAGGIVRGVDALVIEDYTVYKGKAAEVSAGGAVPLSPVRIGAMVALEVEMRGVPVYWQMASMAKGTVTDERLKRWGLWMRGEQHARDAIRHLVTFLRRVENGELEDPFGKRSERVV